MRLFLSYNFDDEPFVRQINYHLRKQESLEPYCYADERHTAGWLTEIGGRLREADAFVLVSGGGALGTTQEEEAKAAVRHYIDLKKAGREFRLQLVALPGAAPLPASLALFDAPAAIKAADDSDESARDCARRLSEALAGRWVPDDDLPLSYLFDYEKKIIEEYSKGEVSKELIEQGCPKEWPRVLKVAGNQENPVKESDIGLYRDWDRVRLDRREEDPQVIVAALTEFHTDRLISQRLTLPEAGPRKYLRYPRSRGGAFNVGILVSGGIAPGINAVIAGIVERQFLYAEKGGYEETLNVFGYQNGLSALFRPGQHYRKLRVADVRSQADEGGSMLGTSRADEFARPDLKGVNRALETAVNKLVGHGTEILYIIGGDGSMRAAHALWKKAKDMGHELSVVAIPKTMDNDILWVWQSFGFLSAVEWSKEAIQQLHTEAESNPRLGVVQLFGSDSGFVVTHAVTASGVCDLFLIPEVPFTMAKISEYITGKLRRRFVQKGLESTHGLVVMAETAIPQDAEDYMKDEGDIGLTEEEKGEILSFLASRKKFGQPRIFGQTPDPLRSGGLKLVSRVLQKNIRQLGGPYWSSFRVFTNEPRYLIRSTPPSSSDIIFAHRLGSLAVDCALAGYTDFMISNWLTEYVMVPLKLVTLGRKRVPKEGIFYKSARASTEQPPDLT
jgi:6-phosphofructokinase 1